MNANRSSGDRYDTPESRRFHRRRLLKDQLARWTVRMGGLAVLGVMLLILFYLAWVVVPLFTGADSRQVSMLAASDWRPAETLALSVEEQSEVGMRISRDGRLEFFAVDTLEPLASHSLLPPGAQALTAVAESLDSPGLLAAGTADGRAVVARQNYAMVYSGDVSTRVIVPAVELPFAGQQLSMAPGQAIDALAVAQRDERLVLAALAAGQLVLLTLDSREDFLTGATRTELSRQALAVPFAATSVALDGGLRWVYVGDSGGNIHVFAVPGLQAQGQVSLGAQAITALRMLLGGTSLLAGDAGGAITQLFPVRDEQGQWALTPIRSIGRHRNAITQILPEQRRRGFMALDAGGHYGIHHSTSGRTLVMREHGLGGDTRAALLPRANAALLVGEQGAVAWLDIDNQHPEVSFATLWQKVWYENYPEPRQTWQSTAATSDFEPKFSLAPLAFGTLKAALYAMLFAVPLALMGATYTAVFMAPALRRKIKPTIEIMAAMPTVVLGFLAGRWLAPFIEQHLAAILPLLVGLPLGMFGFAYLWNRAPARVTGWLPDGWEPLLLVPVLAGLAWLAVLSAQPLQAWLFDGDIGAWLSEEAGLAYDQRNAMVVGIAMGFAVIPTIYSIAEDALFAVPRSLSDGSLALGATRWQTLVRVVLPTASPGIFSGLMIGMGRAVGETMIVLMATGNTPTMDWSMFEGMRTLAANIAIEMPESEVHSTHFRILFLSALVLFVFTFVVNSGAEVVRQRLRARYSAL